MAQLDRVISTILKHERKQTSYKLALVRAVNDVALSFLDLRPTSGFVAIPLRFLAEYWLAYYWPFVDPVAPIPQGVTATGKSDFAFREELAAFRQQWEGSFGPAAAAEGFFVRAELRVARKRRTYPPALVKAYDAVLKKMCRAIEYPIQYAGPYKWSVFTRPAPYTQLVGQLGALPLQIHPLPGTLDTDSCVLLEAALWRTFLDVSLWVEALCIHEWCLFTERVQPKGQPVPRSLVYGLLTARPDNRRPLTWERNQVDLLMLQGMTFTCPWTLKPLTPNRYDMDHIVALAVYPVNELWNLIPADPDCNSSQKRDLLPGEKRLEKALPFLQVTYDNYMGSTPLSTALVEDVGLRFTNLDTSKAEFTRHLTGAVVSFINRVAESRNLARY